MSSLSSQVSAAKPIKPGEGTSGKPTARVKLLQELLVRAAGAVVVNDGEYGEVSLAAVRLFQSKHDISPSGIVGPATAKLLDTLAAGAAPSSAPPSVLAVAPWLSRMRAFTGTREIPGWQSNPVILRWRDELIHQWPELAPNLRWYKNDDTPWCGLAMAAAVGLGAHAYRPPAAPLGAVNWSRPWRDGIRLEHPRLGAIGVWSRTGGHHVSLYESEDARFWHVRGGNQSDSVNLTSIGKDRKCLGWYWPKGAPLDFATDGGATGTGPVSTNEA